MNIILYGMFWAMIGLAAGMMAHWLSDTPVWPGFWVYLALGLLGGLGGGYALTLALFGMQTVLSAYSLLVALGVSAVLTGGLTAAQRRRK
ncbi:MAG: hypothetical protein LBM74_03575 [Oscillospiraceae bacterium]|jgi:uncharacterized membrane protein YeaQ/YmgE (transglycosylase-associated protein family)|nr:hypothetical protein [Oscillospiraceae bacterium]